MVGSRGDKLTQGEIGDDYAEIIGDRLCNEYWSNLSETGSCLLIVWRPA
jgi:hypothetical protein